MENLRKRGARKKETRCGVGLHALDSGKKKEKRYKYIYMPSTISLIAARLLLAVRMIRMTRMLSGYITHSGGEASTVGG